jgi:glycosyltransferase involved in cell wall biosynthesis
LGHVQRGIESWALELGKALAQRDQHVYLCKGAGDVTHDYERVIPCWTRDSLKTARLLRWIPKSLGMRIGLGAGYGVEQVTFAWKLIWFLRHERIDILHLQDPQVAILVQRAVQIGLLKTRTILNHGTDEPSEFLAKIEFLQHGAPWHQQSAIEAGIWKDSWTMIPNFVDTQKFKPGKCDRLRAQLEIPPDALVALVSSAIKKKHKRIDFIVTEFESVCKQYPQLPLWLVIAGGRASDTEPLIHDAQERLGQRVRFVVDAPQSAMPDLYRMADILLHGSLKEMMPMALLEATASGLPCLCHYHPVMEWMVGPGGVALNLEVAGELANAVCSLASDIGRRKTLSKAARLHCISLFDRQTVVDQILAYYSMVHRYRRNSPAKAAGPNGLIGNFHC